MVCTYSVLNEGEPLDHLQETWQFASHFKIALCQIYKLYVEHVPHALIRHLDTTEHVWYDICYHRAASSRPVAECAYI